MRTIPAPLPVDDALVEECESLIKQMNRSERARVHRTLLDERRDARDKSICSNDNIVACRLPHDNADFLETLCADLGTSISNWCRTLITAEIQKEKQRNVAA